VLHPINHTEYVEVEGAPPQQISREGSRELEIRARSLDFVWKVLETYASQIGVLGLGVFTTVVAARILGPIGCGQYAVAVAIGAVGVQLGNMGLHTSNTYVVAKNRELLPVLLANSLLASALIGGVSASFAGFFFAVRSALAPVNGTLLALSLVWIPIGLAQQLAQGLLVGVQETRAYNQIELAKKAFALFFIGLLILIRKITPATVFTAGLVALMSSLILSLARLWRVFPGRLTPSLSLFKWNFGMGAKAYLASFFAFLVIRLDLLMVKYMLGAEQAGYYSIAANLADCVLLLPTAVAMILFPKLSAMRDPAQKLRFAGKAALGAGALLLLLVALAGILAKPVVQSMFGTPFLPAVGAFVLLLPGILFLGIQIVVVQFLNSMGFPRSVVVAWFLSCLLNIGMNLWAIPKYGIRGASIVSSVCYTLMAFLVFAIIRSGKYTRQAPPQRA
jgi:O-antigen/teichoic acid export membrane protein